MKKLLMAVCTLATVVPLCADTDPILKAIKKGKSDKIEALVEARVPVTEQEKNKYIALAQQRVEETGEACKRLSFFSRTKWSLAELAVASVACGASVKLLHLQWEDRNKKKDEQKIWKGEAFFVSTAAGLAKALIGFCKDLGKNDCCLKDHDKALKTLEQVQLLPVD